VIPEVLAIIVITFVYAQATMLSNQKGKKGEEVG
jgi:hypothetical protein